MPDTVQGRFPGNRAGISGFAQDEPVLILTAMIAVYIVLGMLYESFIHPITILSTLPSAGLGALLALLYAARIDLSIVSIIGIILLIGIVKKNAIMMVDFALEAERNEGKSPDEAIYQACFLRFRPIIMTTLAAMFGAIAARLGPRQRPELRQPLGIAIVGGLIVPDANLVHYARDLPLPGSVAGPAARSGAGGRTSAGVRSLPATRPVNASEGPCRLS